MSDLGKLQLSVHVPTGGPNANGDIIPPNVAWQALEKWMLERPVIDLGHGVKGRPTGLVQVDNKLCLEISPEILPIHEYKFDVELKACVAIRTTSREVAEGCLEELFDDSELDGLILGGGPDGIASATITEVSLGEAEPHLFEVDGENVEEAEDGKEKIGKARAD